MTSGACGLVCYVGPGSVWAACAGDSRAVLVSLGLGVAEGFLIAPESVRASCAGDSERSLLASSTRRIDLNFDFI